jgi:serine/threonine protein kinase
MDDPTLIGSGGGAVEAGTRPGQVPSGTIQSPPFAAPLKRPASVREALLGLPGPGQKLGDFELLRLLGTGSFAKVFLARQASLDRQVALKVSLNRGHEARTLAGLEHDHIVRVFSEVIDAERDLRLVCMQYVPGATLEEIIDALASRRGRKASGRAVLEFLDEQVRDPAALDLAALRDRELLAGLDAVEAGCWMGARLAEALAHAHGLGVLHRDVKPANILVNRYGRPLLVDFNVSRSSRPTERPAAETLGGTLAYMAPEHLDAFAKGRDDESVNASSDVYSLGVVLYELFAGRRPFPTPLVVESVTAMMHGMADERRGGPPPLPPEAEAPPSLQRVLSRCLAPRPEDRFATAAELAAALDSCLELRRVERDLVEGEQGRGRLLTRWALRYPFLVAAALLLLPHVLAGGVNIAYNAVRIGLSEPQRAVFPWLALAYNVVVWPVCLFLLFRQVAPVFRTWRQLSRPGPIGPEQVRAARARALRLPVWGIGLSCLGWLPGGLIFPLALHLLAGPAPDPPLVFVQFVFSFTISGLIALSYSVVAVEFVVVRVLYPGLWLDARQMRQTARSELAREEARLAVLQFLAALIPLAGAALLLGLGPEEFTASSYRAFRLLVTGLLGVGMGGLGLAILAGGEVRRTVAALTGAAGRSQ